MKVQIDLPDELVEELDRQSNARNIALDAYAAELFYQLLANQSLGKDATIQERPDWQAALERSREDLAAGRIVRHEEVEQWHRLHAE